MKEKVFNKLLRDMEEVLADYGWEYNHETMKLVAQKWATNKTELREIFSKHPFWIEEKQYVVFTQDYERRRDSEGIERFREWMINEINKIKIVEAIPNLKQFALSYFSYVDIFNDIVLVPLLKGNSSSCTDDQEYMLNRVFPELKFKKGQKLSRIVGKICKHLKFDEKLDYEREYAKFTDSLNPIKYKRFTILSINPIDFLLMSNGNSWSSCQTIDVHQKYQSSYHGESCSGTMSYMLDKTSFVMYTVDAKYNGKDFEIQPKINRQMYQYGDYKLLQGRLYPQNNDGQVGDDLRTEFRNIAQKVVADCLEKPNLWTLRSSTGFNSVGLYANLPGSTHYPDYLYDRNKCTLSLMKVASKEEQFTQNEKMYIGSGVRCIVCGKVHDLGSSLYCPSCKELIEEENCEDEYNEEDEW